MTPLSLRTPCASGKKRYLNRQSAEAGLRRSLAGWGRHRPKNWHDRKLEVYRCSGDGGCGFFHLGHRQ